MPFKLSTDRTFDYRPRLVEANKPYRMGVAGDTDKAIYWTPGVVLDQGQEGSCVGHGVVGEWLASPVRGDLLAVSDQRTIVGHQTAVQVYNRCRQIDEFEGDDTEGTSVRAGMLVGRERGWYSGFRWAMTMPELRAALDLGPVVIGVEWYDSMYEADPHGVIPRGQMVGGHCLLITGYSPDWDGRGPHFRWRNSWGPSYGRNGSAYISTSNLDRILFQAGGEAAVPVGRAA